MKIFIAAILLCGVQAGPVLMGAPSVSAPRIIQGIVAAEGAWPAQLSLQRLREDGWGHTCGATLLNVNYALTAAHCVDGSGPADRLIEAGINIRHDTNGQLKTLSAITPHENYLPIGTYRNDVAVVRFSTPVELNARVQPGILPDAGEDFVDAECIITGWGRIDSSNDIPMDLRQASINVLSHDECQTRLPQNILNVHICIFDPNSVHGACNGDSGGPINCRHGDGEWKQVGVASWVIATAGNCNVNFPSVYGRVTEHLGWISDNTP